jgi:hypothetical protein
MQVESDVELWVIFTVIPWSRVQMPGRHKTHVKIKHNASYKELCGYMLLPANEFRTQISTILSTVCYWYLIYLLTMYVILFTILNTFCLLTTWSVYCVVRNVDESNILIQSRIIVWYYMKINLGKAIIVCLSRKTNSNSFSCNLCNSLISYV